METLAMATIAEKNQGEQMLGEEKGHDELALRKEWMAEARAMTAENLPAFINKLSTFDHDYGTICRAIAAAAIGAAWAVERGPQGGITGFQAGCIMWDLITGWDDGLDGKPLRLVNYEHMLFPQYQSEFDRTISKGTWEFLQSEARKKLDSGEDASIMHQSVKEHLQSIVDGVVPFGFTVAAD